MKSKILQIIIHLAVILLFVWIRSVVISLNFYPSRATDADHIFNLLVSLVLFIACGLLNYAIFIHFKKTRK